MWRATIKGVLARKVRLALTAVAIVLGVVFVTGSYVLTDTLKRSFGQVFAQLAVGSDVVVRTKSPLNDAQGERVRMPAGVAPTIAAVPGVQTVEGSVFGYAQLVEKSGHGAIQNGAAPTIGTSWTRSAGPLRIVDGRRPERDGEVVLDVGSARRHGFAVGDSVKILLTGPAQRFTLVGTFAVGDRSDLGAVTWAAFEAKTAQRGLGAHDSFDWFYVRAQPGVSSSQVVANLRARLPGYDVVDSGAFAQELGKPVRQGLGFLNDALLGFAALGLFVGAFVILNTFTILVQQRTRELALLRALGASGTQVVGSVVIEALAVGGFAALSGFWLGLALAKYLLYLLPGMGFPVPGGETVVLQRTVEAAVVVGVLVTVVAALIPAVRAARTAPIVAINEVRPMTVLPLVRRGIVGALVSLAGLGILAYGLWGDIADITRSVEVVGVGALTFFAGVATLGPLLARPLVRVVGTTSVNVGLSIAGGILGVGGLVVGGAAAADGRWLVVTAAGLVTLGGFVLAFAGPTAFGVLGSLARGNATRNPRRTSATAFALVIGLAPVCLLATFASSAKASVRSALDEGLRADFVISAQQFTGFSTDVAARVGAVPAVVASTGMRFADGKLGARDMTFAAADPSTLDEVVNLDYATGDSRGLAHGGVAIYEGEAKDRGLRVGDTVVVQLARAGLQQLPIVGVYRNRQFTGAFPVNVLVSLQTFDAGTSGARQDTLVFAKARPGQVDAARRNLKLTLRDFPNVTIDSRVEYRQQQEQTIDTFLNVIVGLLAFSFLIAVVGIVNTLFLSVFERTRELGLLRVAGMSRRQVRRMIRGESVIVAMIGCVVGMGMGLLWGWAFVSALHRQGVSHFDVPIAQLAVYLVLAAVAGVVAALLPAWRAGRLDVLDAIASE